MKPYLTLDETKSILDLIKSNDWECVLLGLNILTSKSFKPAASLKTAIYNAQCLLREIKKHPVVYYTHISVHYKNRLCAALYRYIERIEGPTGY